MVIAKAPVVVTKPKVKLSVEAVKF